VLTNTTSAASSAALAGRTFVGRVVIFEPCLNAQPRDRIVLERNRPDYSGTEPSGCRLAGKSRMIPDPGALANLGFPGRTACR
jgi:hypothetical protein